jgi:hypothetical protein
MPVVLRLLAVIVLALSGAVGLAVSLSMPTALQLLAATALIMGSTSHPLINPSDTPSWVSGYMTAADHSYIGYTTTMDVNTVAVYTPEEFIPDYGSMTLEQSVGIGQTGLRNCLQGSGNCVYNHDVGSQPFDENGPFVVFGHSQSSLVASLVKKDLINNPSAIPSGGVTFILVANPMRPNGGVLVRFPELNIPVVDIKSYGASPTNSPDNTLRTIDVSRQYDGFSDFHVYPLNLIADANAIAGATYLHGGYLDYRLDDAVYQGTTGDTDYYIIPTDTLPLLIPLQQAGVPQPVVAALDAPLRVIVEWGYDRSISPGVPTKAGLVPFTNPVTDLANLARSIPVGIDDGVQAAGAGRPLGTTAADFSGLGVSTAPAPGSTPNIEVDVPAQKTSRTTGPATTVRPAPTPVQPGSQPQRMPTKDWTMPVHPVIRRPITFTPSKSMADKPCGDGSNMRVVTALTPGQTPPRAETDSRGKTQSAPEPAEPSTK